MNFINNLSGHNLWYIPLLVAAVLLLFGFFTGFWRGWKSSLFFMIWNIVGFYVALFVLDAIYDSTLKGSAKEWFSSIGAALGPDSFDKFLNLFHGWLVLMLVLAILSVWNFIAWFVHLFLKKRFMQHLKDNKAAGKSNVGSRLLGGLFGIIAVIPTTASAMASSTVISSNDQINKGVDKFVNAFTFGKVNQISEDWEAIYEMVLSAKNAEDLGRIASANILYYDDPNIQDITKTHVGINVESITNNSKTLVKMFNNPKSADTAKSVILYQIGKFAEDYKNAGGNADDTKLTNKNIQDMIDRLESDQKSLKGVFKDLNQNGTTVLEEIFAGNALDKSVDVNVLVNYLTGK